MKPNSFLITTMIMIGHVLRGAMFVLAAGTVIGLFWKDREASEWIVRELYPGLLMMGYGCLAIWLIVLLPLAVFGIAQKRPL